MSPKDKKRRKNRQNRQNRQKKKRKQTDKIKDKTAAFFGVTFSFNKQIMYGRFTIICD